MRFALYLSLLYIRDLLQTIWDLSYTNCGPFVLAMITLHSTMKNVHFMCTKGPTEKRNKSFRGIEIFCRFTDSFQYTRDLLQIIWDLFIKYLGLWPQQLISTHSNMKKVHLKYSKGPRENKLFKIRDIYLQFTRFALYLSLPYIRDLLQTIWDISCTNYGPFVQAMIKPHSTMKNVHFMCTKGPTEKKNRSEELKYFASLRVLFSILGTFCKSFGTFS